MANFAHPPAALKRRLKRNWKQKTLPKTAQICWPINQFGLQLKHRLMFSCNVCQVHTSRSCDAQEALQTFHCKINV